MQSVDVQTESGFWDKWEIVFVTAEGEIVLFCMSFERCLGFSGKL